MMMRQISTIIKSMIFVTTMCIYMFSGSSLAWGTCGIGYVKGLKLSKIAWDSSTQPSVDVFIDNTGFVSPGLTPAHETYFGGAFVPAISIVRGADNNIFGFYYDMLKMAQAARIPVRIFYHNADSDCQSTPDRFIITLCTHEGDCNSQ